MRANANEDTVIAEPENGLRSAIIPSKMNALMAKSGLLKQVFRYFDILAFSSPLLPTLIE